MYNENNVAGTGNRKINYANGNVAGDFGRRCNGDVAGDVGRRRCDFVYECLEELLESVLGERGRRRNCDCDFVYECLEELLEEVLGESGNHCKCRRDNN